MLDSFEGKTGKKGMMVSAVDLLKGIAVGAGMGISQVEGANGGLHTNYEGKVEAALKALLDISRRPMKWGIREAWKRRCRPLNIWMEGY